MKRAARLNPLLLSLHPRVTRPLWWQVSIGLRVAIANGVLCPGARLPSTRVLARQLNVSRTTVMSAYDDLAARGLLTGWTGAGSFVADIARASAPLKVRFQDDSGNLLSLGSLP